MHAFIRIGEYIAKVYDQGSDWQVVTNNSEYWFSVWVSDERASIERAMIEACSRDGFSVTKDQIIFV